MASEITQLREKFFDLIFGDNEGFVCIATRQAHQKETFKQNFFKWPEQKNNISAFLDQATHRKDVWYCPSLLERAERKKEFCLPSDLVYADLDDCDPKNISPTPTIVIETSPNRFQALWQLEQKVEPYLQEDFNKRIAYKYADNGADPSGWDLTQLLRVPHTFNYKYEDAVNHTVPEVKVLQVFNTKVPTDVLTAIPVVKGKQEAEIVPSPDLASLPAVDNIIYRYAPYLRNTAFNTLYLEEPKAEDDWSRVLWRLINICIEAGMSNEETFAVCLSAKCNKYARDNRPPFHLWQDILRADAGQRRLTLITGKFEQLTMPELVKEVDVTGSFIQQYKEWASNATDAVESFHELSAAILLSAVASSGIRIKTNYGDMVPNLWGLILGDSTLTRKTTAMRMAMDIVADVDSEIILATDGSAEGLLTGLSSRPYRPSIFFKDEVSGFVDSINRKDYLAGMPETLTQLYDVPRIYTRRLRKETITISSPVFIFFGGGIRDKVYSLLTDEYVLSGFLPRFLVVSGDSDLSRIKRTGPASKDTSESRANLVERMKGIYQTFNSTVEVEVLGQKAEVNKEVSAELSNDAWETYGDIEFKMVQVAADSEISMLALPTFERMSRSILKLSTLLAAAKREPVDAVLKVEKKEVLEATYFVQRWGNHSIDLIRNAGTGTTEREIQKILRTIQKHPDLTRSRVMQAHNLTKRQADEILGTLEDRGLVMARKEGRGVRLRALE